MKSPRPAQEATSASKTYRYHRNPTPLGLPKIPKSTLEGRHAIPPPTIANPPSPLSQTGIPITWKPQEDDNGQTWRRDNGDEEHGNWSKTSNLKNQSLERGRGKRGDGRRRSPGEKGGGHPHPGGGSENGTLRAQSQSLLICYKGSTSVQAI